MFVLCWFEGLKLRNTVLTYGCVFVASDEDDESEQNRLDAKISGQTLQSKAPRRVDDNSAPSFSLMPDFDTPPGILSLSLSLSLSNARL